MLEKILQKTRKSLCALLFSLPLVSCEAPNQRTNIWEDKYGSIMLDISGGYKEVSFSKEAIPKEVKAEAANPTITNPNTGHSFNSDKIPPYNSADCLSFGEVNIEAKYIFPRIPFFIGGDLNFPFYSGETDEGGQITFADPRTDNGFSGKGYSHSVVIDSSGTERPSKYSATATKTPVMGCDTIDYDPYETRYFYGIRYSPWVARPVVGFHFEIGDEKTRFFLEPSLKYEQAEVSYIKGLEFNGGDHLRTKMASEIIDVYDVSIKAGVLGRMEEKTGLIKSPAEAGAFIYGGPLFTSKEGISGWSIGFGLAANF